MIGFRVEIREEELQDRLGALSNKANLVMARAANRAITNAKKNVKKETSARYRIKQGDVEKTIKVIRGNQNQPSAKLISKDVHPNLVKFQVLPKKQVKREKVKKMKPYRASVKKSTSAIPLDGSSSRRKPFIMTMKNGFTGLFRQKRGIEGMAGYIEGIYGPAVPQIIKNEEIMNKVQAEASKMMLERIDHEIDQILR